MKDMKIVQGSAEQALPLIIGKDTVYVHTDIASVLKDNEGNQINDLFQYHEIQYLKDEYIKIMADKNSELSQKLTDIQQVTDGLLISTLEN